MQIGNRDFATREHTYVMGILNVTPDSFSDGGSYLTLDAALKQTEKMMKDGADIIDIGGESTRPGATPISVEEEIERVMPFVEGIKSRFDIPVSLDTYKSQVAEAGAKAGVDMINDVWGLKYDPKMAEVIAKNKICCCLMHNREKLVYNSLLADVKEDLWNSVNMAIQEGVSYDKIMIDPGIGFAKDYEQNLQILQRLEEFKILGYPIMLGCSRKSVIGQTLDLPVDMRLNGTLATTALAVMKGASFVRVHDVKENIEIIKMVEAILKA